MATGDLKNNLKQFQSQVKAIKYSAVLDIEGLKLGSPKAYLPLYHYLFTSYSNKFNKDIVNSNNELYGKSDLRFMEAVYKIMRVLFSHKPAITREQFFSTGFTERKLIMATDIFRLVHSHYKPQRNSTSSGYKFAANIEKPAPETSSVIHQDMPETIKTRKIASRPSPSMSGAVVLPRSFSGSSLMRSSHKPSMPLPSYDFPTSDTSQERISATPRSDQSMREVERLQEQNFNNNTVRGMTDEMTKKMADQLTHSVIFLNEKIGKMALVIQNQEKLIENSTLKKQEPTEPTSTSTMLMTNLNKQMNDILFKMETLSSRVVLLENRMMMMEAKVDDTQSQFRTCMASRNRPKGGLQGMSDSCLKRNLPNSSNTVESSQNNTITPELTYKNMSERESAKPSTHVVREFTPDEKTKHRGGDCKEILPQYYSTNDRSENTNMQEEEDDDSVIEVIGVETEDVAASGTNMAFMKSLIDRNSMISDTSAGECTLTTAQIEQLDDLQKSNDNPAQRFQSHNPSADEQSTASNMEMKKNADGLENTFGDFFSPIRSFSDASAFNTNTSLQDSSAISIPYAADDEEDNRRFSTPNKAMLDTSTLSRVSRITQMLTETDQLFN